MIEFEKVAFIEYVKSYKREYRHDIVEDNDKKNIRRMLSEFNFINDNKADVFRYLIDKKGDLHFTESRFVDYDNLKEAKVLFTLRILITEAGGTIMIYLKIKRLIDIILSTLGLIILSPVFLVLIIAIKLDSSGPILFKQKRVGIHKKHFNILKFRTMRIDTPKDTPTHLLEDPDKWITKVGKFLRKTSLDELPQIINIFKGEMSIIGPRPALWNQYDLIEERDKYGANDVPVGLTGWAQINGRDELEIDVKARLDGEYAEKIGFMMDVRCFFGTIFSVLRSDGVVEGGTGTKKADKESVKQ